MTLYLIIGPPASGKTTWVKQHARHGDIVIDYDVIASALSPTGGDPYDQPDAVKAVTKAARKAATDAALSLAHVIDVYVIHAMPSARLLADYRQRGAQIVTVDPGPDVVLARCKAERPWRMTQAAKEWYAKKQSDMTPASVLERPASHHRKSAERSTARRNRHRRIIARGKPPCHLCGGEIDYSAHHLEPLSFQIDHIIPLSRGGSDVLDNLAPAHRHCNRLKSDGSHGKPMQVRPNRFITGRAWGA